MKKILIASTALVAAGMITAGSASASEKIKLNLGGYSKWWVVGAWQDDSFEAAGATGNAGEGSANSVDVKGENEVWFGGSTTLDNGLQVGVDMQLRAGGNTDTVGGDTIDESYVWVSGGFGKVIIGTENNGTYLLHVTAPDAAGNWNEGGVMMGNLAIAKPSNVSGLGGGNTTAINTDGDAEKITYVAPAFYGLTLGASYVPNTSQDDANVFNATTSTTANTAAQEIYGVGALYSNTFGGVGVKVSAGYVTYDVSKATDSSQELAFGTQLSYAGFTLGGSYRDVQQNFGSAPTNGGAAPTASSTGYGWDVGLQYATGPYAVSLAYFNSKVEGSLATDGEDEITAYQLSGKYNMGAGVDLLASVGHIEYDDELAKTSNADANHNEGWTVMTGLSLQF